MHQLNNGSQVTVKPKQKNPMGQPGFFTEGGQGVTPSYPGADYFNAQIEEFIFALKEMNIAFDPTRFDHLARLLTERSPCENQITAVKTYTESGIYTPPENLIQIEVIVIGGGGGGGCAMTNVSNGSGGAGGGTAISYFNAQNLTSSMAVTIGLGGNGGTSGWGSSGGDSSFNEIVATGGTGGSGSATSGGGAQYGGTGNGDINIPGGGANYGSDNSSGAGGSSYLSGGAPSARNEAGHNGQGAGAGGSGGSNMSNSNNIVLCGGRGANGIVIIKEHLIIKQGGKHDGDK